MGAARYIRLSDEEDVKLRELEQSQALRAKVRLRGSVLRLSNRGWQVEEIARFVKRSRRSILRDFDRWETRGLEGLADGSAPGHVSPISEVHRSFLRERLAEERSWTAGALAEELQMQFGIAANRESVRVCVLGMGYSWQRHRYVPVKTPDPELLREAEADLGLLKRGPARGG